MSTTTTIAARRFIKITAEGEYLIAKAKLDHIQGNAHPYFSLTGEMWESERHYVKRTHRETGLICAGAMGDEIVTAFKGDPLADEIAHFAAMHLADDDGAPMYAVENGWYWYSDYDGKGTTLYPHQEPLYSMTPHERGAHYLRIDPDALPRNMDKDAFAAFVDTQRDRWKEDAARALAFLNDTQ